MHAGHVSSPQLGEWDGKDLADTGPGIAFGACDIVSKIDDSYLGIGDKVRSSPLTTACGVGMVCLCCGVRWCGVHVM